MACMHCTDAPCAAVCPVNCFYTTADARGAALQGPLHRLRLLLLRLPVRRAAISQGRQLRLARQDGQVHLSAPAARRRTARKAEYEKYGANRLAEGKLPLCAEMCSTKSLLAGDGEIIAQIYKERVVKRGYGSGAWGWKTAYQRSRSRPDAISGGRCRGGRCCTANKKTWA